MQRFILHSCFLLRAALSSEKNKKFPSAMINHSTMIISLCKLLQIHSYQRASNSWQSREIEGRPSSRRTFQQEFQEVDVVVIKTAREITVAKMIDRLGARFCQLAVCPPLLYREKNMRSSRMTG